MTLSVNDIEKMSYVDFISFLRETNRCPGGKDAIRKILQQAHVDRESQVLEVGSNTGFTSLEIARTAKCKVSGIDVVQKAVEESNRELAHDTPQVRDLVSFQEGSAYEIPFQADLFDLLVCGGATSFMGDKQKALQEYWRVLKPWGFLSVTNLCYIQTPPASVVEDVSRIIGVNIDPWTADQWLELFRKNELFETYYQEKNELMHQSSETLDTYVQYFLKKPHIAELSDATKKAVQTKWRNILDIFNENHRYLGYVLVLFRKRQLPEEPELFIQRKNHVS